MIGVHPSVTRAGYRDLRLRPRRVLAILAMLAPLRVAPGGSGRSVAYGSGSRSALRAGDGRAEASGGGSRRIRSTICAVRWSRRTSTRGSEFVSSGGQFRVSLDNLRDGDVISGP